MTGAGTEALRERERLLAELAIEAGVETPLELPLPTGNLKRDIESFTSLDACVRTHAPTDALLADAIDALGYDTFIRDACRILQALKARDSRLCRPIAASPLRARCETYVAILSGNADLCPVVHGAGSASAREPVCLARASRDDRFCAGALAVDRAACRALVAGRADACGRDQACIGQVERWRTLMVEPAAKPAFHTHIRVEFTVDSGDAESKNGSFDLDELAAAGAVVRASGDKTRLSLGSPKNALWPTRNTPRASPRLFLEVVMRTSDIAAKRPAPGGGGDASASGSGAIALGPDGLAIDLLLPGVAELSGVGAAERKLEIVEWGTGVGSPVRFTLSSKLVDAPDAFRVNIDVETYVRDVIAKPSAMPRAP